MRNSALDQLTISQPCNADWDSMKGNDQIRFCEHCNLHVNDLSRMTRPQAMRLVEQSRGRLCVRYLRTSKGEILTQDTRRLFQIGRRVSQLAAGAFTATMSLSTVVAQGRVLREDEKVVQGVPRAGATQTKTSCVISGVVTDPNGAVIPGLIVTLTNTTTQGENVATSSADGEYEFKDIPAGPYKLKILSPGGGFKDLELKDIDLPPGATKRLENELQLDETVSVTVGVVAIVDPHDPLIKAAYKNDLVTVLTLLPVAADVNEPDKDTDTTALQYAVQNHNQEMVNALVSAGANLNRANTSGRTPLMFLSDAATPEFVRSLVSAGADVNAADESGQTVLMAAAGSCKLDVLKELIAAGARTDTKTNEGYTPLMWAAMNADPEVVKFLIESGVSIDATNTDGESALLFAARAGKGETLKALINAGAALNLSADDLDDALLSAVGNDDSSTVTILLDAGADANAIESGRKTALMQAAMNGKAPAVEALLKAGADVNAVDDDGWTALMYCDGVDNVRLLLKAGADMTVRNKEGQTALAVAAKAGQEEIVKLLKSRGAPE
jgi:ankyrin repeat protein